MPGIVQAGGDQLLSVVGAELGDDAFSVADDTAPAGEATTIAASSTAVTVRSDIVGLLGWAGRA